MERTKEPTGNRKSRSLWGWKVREKKTRQKADFGWLTNVSVPKTQILWYSHYILHQMRSTKGYQNIYYYLNFGRLIFILF